MKLFNIRLPHSADAMQVACSRSIVNVLASIFENSPEVVYFNIEGIDHLDHHKKYQVDLYPERAEQQRQRAIDLLKPWPFESIGIKIGLPIWKELWEYYYPLTYSSISPTHLNIGYRDQYLIRLNINRTLDLLSDKEVFTVGKYQFHHATSMSEAQVKRKLDNTTEL